MARYIGQCDRVRRQGASNEQKWHAMMCHRQPVSTDVFLRHVDISPLLDEGETARQWLTNAQRSDPSTQTYRSWWGPKPCWFIQTAGYEFIFEA